MRARRSALTIVTLLLVLPLAACGSEQPAAVDNTDLFVAVASYDLSVGEDRRLMAGVLTPELESVLFGEVTFELGYLGEEPTGAAELAEQVTATFLAVPGMEPDGDPGTATLDATGTGEGVYEARVNLDRAGFWGLRVTAELDDGTVRSGARSFAVVESNEVPAPGDPAPRSQNPTLEDVEAGTVEAVSLDSRAQGVNARIPDEHLHQHRVAESIEAGRPVVVTVSTPVYCVSRFCGPLVEVIAQLALDYDDRADFVMIEVWEDFDEQRLNPAAAEWIQTELGGNEPWVFLVDAEGLVKARWDNVLDVGELIAELDALPLLTG